METETTERRAKLAKPRTAEQERRIRLRKIATSIRAALYLALDVDAKMISTERLSPLRGRLPVWFRRAISPRLVLGLKPLVLHEPFRVARESERPPAEQAQHGVFIFEVTERDSTGNPTESRVRNMTPLSIDWYWRKGTIDAQMREAGLRFGQLYFEAGKVPRVNVMYRERIQRSARASDFELGVDDYTDAQKALNAALDVLAPLEVDVLRDVAGLNMRAGAPGRVRLLQLGLRALVVHFGITFDVDRSRRGIKIPKPKKVP